MGRLLPPLQQPKMPPPLLFPSTAFWARFLAGKMKERIRQMMLKPAPTPLWRRRRENSGQQSRPG
jgi:hypothetical protein